VEEEKVLQAKTETAEPSEVSADVEVSIRTLSSGSPLPDPVRSIMEPRFGADFGNVRVHSDAGAHDLARAVSARAFTVGRDIVFGAGKYASETEEGRRLLAHELTHGAQQGAQGKEKTYGASDSKNSLISLQTSEVVINRTLDSDAVKYADNELWKAYPELKGRKLTTDKADEHLRREWHKFYNLHTTEIKAEAAEGPQAGPAESLKGSQSPAAPSASPPLFVCARDLQGILGNVGNHAYIEAPPFRYAIITRCKPTSGSENVLTGTAATKTDVSPDPCGKTPTCVECVPKPGITDLAKCFRDAFTAYNDPSLYRGLGPNSNTFARTLAKTCCNNMTPKPKALGTVPGWDDAPAPARAASCPSGPPKC